ncbi:hypothetical protein AABB24_030732 [Solanum stoloniferum]|uniref:Uncharacterized protein n=1 Tax=Solanum stoloniferum TaxID=62892 RepID=A0ABD2RQE7_9SOLN
MVAGTYCHGYIDQTIMDNEGNRLLQQLHEYPIILACCIGGSRYNGISLTTKFNTTILIDPPYGQKQQLQAWITENKATLTSFTSRSTSKSGTLISIPVDEEVILIANAESQEDGQTFSIEAKISFPPDQKKYYVLVCSNCGQDVRYSIIMQIHCMNCGQHTMLIPSYKTVYPLVHRKGIHHTSSYSTKQEQYPGSKQKKATA